jgi:ketosteroid isomerase-like protein
MSSADPASVATRYFEAIRARDADAVRMCFAEDAELLSAAGTLRGRDAIAEFYAGTAFAFGELDPRPGPYVIDGDRLAVEIDLRIAGRSNRVADFFDTRDGLIRHLAIYMLPAADR